MAVDNVRFGFRNKVYNKKYDRDKLYLGKVLYIRESSDDAEFFETHVQNSKRVAVYWIATSEWYVPLIDTYTIEEEQIRKVQHILNSYLEAEVVKQRLVYLASKLRIEHLYKTSEYEKSDLRKVFAVVERLELISIIKRDDFAKELIYHWEPLIVYHLLTCFDLLGQPADWVPFEGWLERNKTSKSKEFNSKSNYEVVKKLYSDYIEEYGTKNSFYRFLFSVLPDTCRKQLFDSIRIEGGAIALNFKQEQLVNEYEQKARYLYSLRNNYTHSVLTVRAYSKSLAPWILEPGKHFSMKNQEIKAKTVYTYYTLNWPTIIEHCVKSGIKEFLLSR